MKNSVFTFDSPRIQQFSLPSNIFYYLNRNKEYPKVLQKLQQSCKYFFARNKLLINEDGWFENTHWPKSWIIHEQQNLPKCNAKLSFIGKLFIHLWRLNSNIYKNLCSKIFYNNITLLSIYFTTLDLSDYEILTSSKSLTDVDIQYSVILNEEKNDVKLNEILKFTSNIASFRCIKSIIEVSDGNTITNQILENIFANITENSIDNFFISGYFLSSFFDPNLLCKFIEKAAASKAVFTFSVNYALDGQKQQISTALFQMLDEWNIPEQKPQIVLSAG